MPKISNSRKVEGEELRRKLKGIEYSNVRLKGEETLLFIIAMRFRHSEKQTEALAYFYILGGEVF